MKFYIATTLTNVKAHNLVRDGLVALGHEITYDWTTHGPVWEQGLLVMQETAERELKGVEDADFVVVLLPGHRGTHVELGAAIAYKKRIFIFSVEDEIFTAFPGACVFHHYPGIERISGEIVSLAAYISHMVTIY